MKRRFFITLSGLGLLAACGSRLNPLGWFGPAEPAPRRVGAAAVPVEDPRPLVPRVSGLTVEPVAGGAVVRASGLPDRQGWYAAELVETPSSDPAVLAYAFRAMPPPGPTRASTPASRELVVATRVGRRDLAGIREIRVSGAENGLAARR